VPGGHADSGGTLGSACLSSSACLVAHSECAMHIGQMTCVCMYGFVAVDNKCFGL
jgi:hypothetical protein